MMMGLMSFNVEQARQFCQARSFQVDMTYKRAHGDIYEAAFAVMNEAFGSASMYSLFLFVFF
jgi:hypothetical protein